MNHPKTNPLPPEFFNQNGRAPTLQELKDELWRLHLLERRGGIYSKGCLAMAKKHVKSMLAERGALTRR